MWSSTHFETGPIPEAQKMSVPASATDPCVLPADDNPKLLLVFMANWSVPCSLTTSPGHWSGWTGIMRYASATSRMDACEPGGRCQIKEQRVLKVP
jgi:hypothetical protein